MASFSNIADTGKGESTLLDTFAAHSKDLGLERGMLCVDQDCQICMEYAVRLIVEHASHSYKIIETKDAVELARQHHPFIPT